MEDIDKIIRTILSKYDLSSEEGRDGAFEECVEYAERELALDLRCNTFLRKVAELLEKSPIEYDVIRDLVDMPDDASLDVTYEERHGFVITGNRNGLLYLAKLLEVLADAPSGEHIHLYNDEDPLTQGSFNSVVYVEEDEWFSRLEKQDAAGRGEFRGRDLAPEDIFAFQLVSDVPHDVFLTRDKIYRVQDVSEPEGAAIWKKPFNGEDERYVSFRVFDDEDRDVWIILHLDDPDINYFRESDFTDLLD